MKTFLTSTILFAAMAAFSITANNASAGGGSGGHSCHKNHGHTGHHHHHHIVIPCRPVPPPPPLVVIPPPPLPTAPAGSTLTIAGNGFGPVIGIGHLMLGQVKLPVNFVQWGPNAVTVKLPEMGILSPTRGELMIMLPDGRLVRRMNILLVAQPPVNVNL